MIRSVGIDVTKKCNLSCPFCHTSASPAIDTSTELTAEQWFAALAEFPYATNFYLSGGEPLLPEMQEKTKALMRYILAKEGTQVKVNTNGTNAMDFSEFDPARLHVQVSIDGPCEVHDGIRGKGVYHKALGFLEKTLQQGIPCSVKCVLFESAVADSCIEHVCSLQKKHDINAFFQIFSAVGRGADCNKDIFNLREALEKKIAEHGVLYKALIENCTGFLGNGGHRVNIDAEGFFVPCFQLRDYRTDINIADGFNEFKTAIEVKKKIKNKTCSCL